MSLTLSGSSVLQCLKLGDALEIRNGIIFDFYSGLPHMYSINISTLSVKYTSLKRVLFSSFLTETKLRSSSLNVPLPHPGSALSTASHAPLSLHRSTSTSPHTSPHNHSPTSNLGSLNVGPVSSSSTRRYEGGEGGLKPWQKTLSVSCVLYWK